MPSEGGIQPSDVDMMLLEGGILHFKGGTTSPGAATYFQRAASCLRRTGVLAAEGGRVPSEGVKLHLEGGVMPSEGGIQSSYGHMMLSEGGILHSKGGTTSPEGGIMPSEGGGEDILPQGAAGYLLRAV